jgi:hypothetical protein
LIYRVYGQALASQVPLLGLPESRGEPADITFRLGKAARSPRWFHSVGESLRLGHARAGFVVDYPGEATFHLRRDGSSIVLREWWDEPAALDRLVAQIVPLALHLKGHAVLHGSSVLTPRGAVAFLGPSGSGKSTLAAGLARLGFPLLADDAIALRGRRVLGSPGLSRLTDRALEGLNISPLRKTYRGKSIARSPSTKRSAPLVGIYLLGEAPTERLCRAEALQVLLQQSLRLDFLSPSRLVAELDALTRLTQKVPASRLRYRHRFSEIERIGRMLK